MILWNNGTSVGPCINRKNLFSILHTDGDLFIVIMYCIPEDIFFQTWKQKQMLQPYNSVLKL